MQNPLKSKVEFHAEELEHQREKISIEIAKTNLEIEKNRKKRLLFLGPIIISVIAIIKIFFGTIEINTILGYSPSEARYYKVTINNKQIPVSYYSRRKIPLIPFLVNFNSYYYLGNSNIVGVDGASDFISDGSKKYMIDITSYSCYINQYQTECLHNEQDMKKNNDTKYTKVTITRTTESYEEVYHGPFIKDITPYIAKKGVYCIQIDAKYFFNEVMVYFYFNKID